MEKQTGTYEVNGHKVMANLHQAAEGEVAITDGVVATYVVDGKPLDDSSSFELAEALGLDPDDLDVLNETVQPLLDEIGAFADSVATAYPTRWYPVPGHLGALQVTPCPDDIGGAFKIHSDVSVLAAVDCVPVTSIRDLAKAVGLERSSNKHKLQGYLEMVGDEIKDLAVRRRRTH